MSRFAMVLEPALCIDCKACMVACTAENNVPLGDHRNWVRAELKGTFPELSMHIEPGQCMHCDDPPCVRVCPPGASYIYCNLSYQLAAHIISEVTGKTYAEYIRESVFLPLGMRHAALFSGQALAGPTTIGYTPTGEPIPPYTAAHPGSGDIFASVHDLIQFAMFHLNDHLPGQGHGAGEAQSHSD